MKTEVIDFDRLSYALGISIGYNFRAAGITELKIQDFADAVAAVFYGQTPKMSSEEAKKTVNEFFMELQKKQQEEAARMADINARAGEEFLLQNGKRAEVSTLPSGLQYEVLESGSGKSPKATDQVTVHYTGKLIDGTVFDSSEERGEPATFAVNQVIPGWVEALQLMKEGDKWRLFIPSGLAYGPQGVPGIGPNQTLLFDVTLIKVAE